MRLLSPGLPKLNFLLVAVAALRKSGWPPAPTVHRAPRSLILPIGGLVSGSKQVRHSSSTRFKGS